VFGKVAIHNSPFTIILRALVSGHPLVFDTLEHYSGYAQLVFATGLIRHWSFLH